ncbi:DNA/RNA helicase, partial [Thermodesulfobacteriota bacterium]
QINIKKELTPCILFRDNFSKAALLIHRLITILPKYQPLNEEKWKTLQSIISGTSMLRKSFETPLTPPQSRRSVLNQLRNQIQDFDIEQEEIGKTIPPGPQRIRGVGGSGKTVLLCQKAAHMHLKYPEWRIALVFFTRSMYDIITETVNKWLMRFSNNKVQYNPNSNLKILHAWGAKDQEGLYRYICKKHNQTFRTVNDIKTLKLNSSDSLIYACKELVENIKGIPLFDAILIDEGQDLVTDKEGLKHLPIHLQPFFWMVYTALHFSDKNPSYRRVIWAYDESQSLGSIAIPKYKELFAGFGSVMPDG